MKQSLKVFTSEDENDCALEVGEDDKLVYYPSENSINEALDKSMA